MSKDTRLRVKKVYCVSSQPDAIASYGAAYGAAMPKKTPSACDVYDDLLGRITELNPLQLQWIGNHMRTCRSRTKHSLEGQIDKLMGWPAGSAKKWKQNPRRPYPPIENAEARGVAIMYATLSTLRRKYSQSGRSSKPQSLRRKKSPGPRLH
jgi:hypothetical protein